MLSKLLKYEYRATAIYFLPIYAMLVLVSGFSYAVRLIGKNVNKSGNYPFAKLVDTLITTFGSLYVLLAVALAITTFIVIIMRFYKNLLGNEGYLMFTLPVSVEENILAKLIPAITWFFGSCLLGVLTLVPTFWGNYGYFFNMFFCDFTIEDFFLGLLLIVFFIACLGLSFLFYYLCMCIGQLFNSHKFIASAAVYIGLQGALQVLAIVGVVLLISFGRDFFLFDAIFDLIGNMYAHLGGYQMAYIFFGIIDVFVLLCAAGLFWIDCRILKKKLNLT